MIQKKKKSLPENARKLGKKVIKNKTPPPKKKKTKKPSHFINNE
jgi:hypothetical protein